MSTPQFPPPWAAGWTPPELPPSADTTPRTDTGQFVPGVSGNPNGKPAGTKHRRTLLAEAFDEGVDDIIAVVKAKARAGDLQAAGLVLARAVPPKRPVSERTPFVLDTTQPLATQAAQVVQAVADGHLSADDAQTVLACLNTYAQLAQHDTLEARLQALERATHAARNRARGHGGVMYVEQPGPPQ